MKKALLLAEDDDDQRASLAEYLKQVGFDVVAVKDGVEALHALELQSFVAAVIDLEMPRLDGRGVLAACSNNPQTAAVPVIIVSGAQNLSGLETAKAVRRKPVQLDELVDLLEHMQGAQLRRACASHPE